MLWIYWQRTHPITIENDEEEEGRRNKIQQIEKTKRRKSKRRRRRRWRWKHDVNTEAREELKNVSAPEPVCTLHLSKYANIRHQIGKYCYMVCASMDQSTQTSSKKIDSKRLTRLESTRVGLLPHMVTNYSFIYFILAPKMVSDRVFMICCGAAFHRK